MTELVFDRYATNEDNHIFNELQEVSNTTARVVVPLHGAFFKKDFEARLASNSTVLTLGTHYKWVSMDPVLTSLTGMEVVNGIILMDGVNAIYSDIVIDYRAVGGKEGKSSYLIKKLRESVQAVADGPVSAANISGLPATWPPSPHDHNMLEDLTNIEPLREAMEGIWDALAKQRPLTLSEKNLFDLVNRMLYVVGESRNDMQKLSLDFSNLVSETELQNLQDQVTILQGLVNFGSTVFVRTLDELPEPDSGVIYLPSTKAWILTPANGVFDFNGLRVVCNGPTNIRGFGSSVCTIKSTGLDSLHPGLPFFTSDYNVIFEDMKIDHQGYLNPVFSVGETTPGVAFFADTFNITNAPNIGTFRDCSALAFVSSYLVASSGIKIAGNLVTLLANRLGAFPTAGSDPVIEFLENSVVLRRSSIVYSTFDLPTGVTGVKSFDPALNFPDNESLVLESCLFDGDGDPLDVALLDSPKIEVVHCHGLPNVTALTNYYMNDNAVVTDIVKTGEAVPVAGTTIVKKMIKFTNGTDNHVQAQFGETSQTKLFVNAAVTTTVNNKVVRLEIQKSLDGVNYTPVEGAVGKTKVRDANEPYGVAIVGFDDVEPGAHLRVFIANETDTTDVLVTDLNVVYFRQ